MPATDVAKVLHDRVHAEGFTASVCFKHGPPALLGVELEWLLVDPQHQTRPLSRTEVREALGDLAPSTLLDRPPLDGPTTQAPLLPAGGGVSCEPGGQLELSSAPQPSLPGLMDAVRADADVLGERLLASGLVRSPWAVDPHRSPTRMLDTPRYVAMERYFDRTGGAGRVMMGSSAAVHVNVDCGTAQASEQHTSSVQRWKLLHRIGPVLVATFANSPLRAGRRTGWASTRMGVWQALDPTRTSPVAPDPRDDADLVDSYARLAMDAPLVCVRRDDAASSWAAPAGMTFADWIDSGDRAVGRVPTEADLAYHLTTLFPPVRAHGHLEVRYLDAQPGDSWDVPLAVLAGLLADPRVIDAALDLSEPAAGRWEQAARAGLADPVIAPIAPALLELAAGALPVLAGDAALAQRYQHALDRARAGRCPGDEQLDALTESPPNGGTPW